MTDIDAQAMVALFMSVAFQIHPNNFHDVTKGELAELSYCWLENAIEVVVGHHQGITK